MLFTLCHLFYTFTLCHLFFNLFTFMSINLCTLNLFHLNYCCFFSPFYSFLFFPFLRIQTQRPILLNEIETKLHSIMRNKGSYIFRNIFLFYSCVFLYTWGSIDSSTAVSIEDYEIQISRSVFHTYPSYLCRISFLTILDIYKDYFKGH